eukprot:968702_1
MVRTVKNDPRNKRSNEYDDLKADFTNLLKDELFTMFPQLKSEVLFDFMGTPLSASYFLGSAQGCSLGLALNPERYRAKGLDGKTPIKGLYLTGQDVCSSGFTGA